MGQMCGFGVGGEEMPERVGRVGPIGVEGFGHRGGEGDAADGTGGRIVRVPGDGAFCFRAGGIGNAGEGDGCGGGWRARDARLCEPS